MRTVQSACSPTFLRVDSGRECYDVAVSFHAAFPMSFLPSPWSSRSSSLCPEGRYACCKAPKFLQASPLPGPGRFLRKSTEFSSPRRSAHGRTYQDVFLHQVLGVPCVSGYDLGAAGEGKLSLADYDGTQIHFFRNTVPSRPKLGSL